MRSRCERESPHGTEVKRGNAQEVPGPGVVVDGRRDRDALFWLFRHSGVMEELPEGLRHSMLAECVTDACELAGFSADKRILYEKDMVTELDLALQYDYAREQGEARGRAEEPKSKLPLPGGCWRTVSRRRPWQNTPDSQRKMC